MNPCTPARQLSERHAGWSCAACQVPLRTVDLVRECTRCGAPQHDACWSRVGACQAYECRPAAGADASAAPAIKIEAREIKDVHVETIETPAGVGHGKVLLARYVPRTTSRAAIVSFVLGVLAVPGFGVTAIPAVVVGAIALAGIVGNRSRKGALWAGLGLGLGLLATAGWIVFLALHHWNKGQGSIPRRLEGHASIEGATPEVRAALERNVLVTLSGRLGSGIVIGEDSSRYLVLTNRHVVDAGFDDTPDENFRDPGGIQVQYHNGVTTSAIVEWTAPHGVDLVRLSCRKEGVTVTPATIDLAKVPRIGEKVFAVGNPEGLDWTYTQGYVSAFRTTPVGGYTVDLIQTQTPLNPGNSGGGLYDEAGNLVGVNTLGGAMHGLEGLNFAISIKTYRALVDEGK